MSEILYKFINLCKLNKYVGQQALGLFYTQNVALHCIIFYLTFLG